MNPITIRQSFQNANLEALREAHGLSEQMAREVAQRKVLQDKTSEAQSNVPEIPKSEALVTEERKGREQQGGQGGHPAGTGGEGQGTGEQESANAADKHLDLLA